MTARHGSSARPVADFGFERLQSFFPRSLLRQASVVVVDRIPRPPVERWVGRNGERLGELPGSTAAGMTIGDMFFVRSGRERGESLFFHELVHVVQWRHLGSIRFLTVYGSLLMQHGYSENPLETMAYGLQDAFNDRSSKPFDVVSTVQEQTDRVLYRFRCSSWFRRLLIAAPA